MSDNDEDDDFNDYDDYDDYDIDDASLPGSDEEAGDPIGLQSRGGWRLPYGDLVIPEGDELVSSSQVIQSIEASQGRHHRLLVYHTELGDAGIEKILQAMRTGRGRSSNVEVSNEEEEAMPHSWANKVSLLLSKPHIQPTRPYEAIRVLQLTDNNLTSASLPAIAALLTENINLHMLDLSANRIGNDPAAFVKLARALGRSNLRWLCLNSNPIAAHSLTVFLDSIPAEGTTLERLEISNVLADMDADVVVSAEDALIAAKAVASLIADPQRCRSIASLRLDGNGFGDRGVSAIISAYVGNPPVTSTSEALEGLDMGDDAFYRAVFQAKTRPPNRALEDLSLAGNMEERWRPNSQQAALNARERYQKIWQRYCTVPLDEIPTIVSFFDRRARQIRFEPTKNPDIELPWEVSRHLANLDVTLDEWQKDLEEVAEVDVELNHRRWEDRVLDRFHRNAKDSERCRRAAASILAAARILGCRSKRGNADVMEGLAEGFHRFLDLPSELKLLVLRLLDEADVLSARQFDLVISFACEADTIGYGDNGFDWSRVSEALANPNPAGDLDHSASTVLPAPRWSWKECFKFRAPPRDWEADLLDCSDEDGRFIRSRSISNDSESYYTDASLYAFLESTMTHRAED